MIRKIIWLGCALAAFSGALVAVLSAVQQRDFELRGYVDATRTQDLPFRIPRLGVNAELTQYSPEELRYHFDLMREAHVVWVRQFARWDEIEPVPGQYDWESWDTIIEEVADYPDLQLVAVLGNTPEWACRPGAADDPTSPPADPNRFADFAYAFARRYGHMIDVYQVWDEPNILLGWGLTEPNVADYAALLQMTYAAIHGADRYATVIAAAL